MAKKIQAWRAFGPRIDHGSRVTHVDFIDNVTAGTNQTKGSILAVLAEQDVQMLAALRSGHILRLPNGMHLLPMGKRDGSIKIHVHVSRELVKQVNASFRGVWINGENIGKTEAEIMALWNAAHPDDPIEDFEEPPAPPEP